MTDDVTARATGATPALRAQDRTAADSWRCDACGGDRYEGVATGNPPRTTLTTERGTFHMGCLHDPYITVNGGRY